jgi:hypothetical protein
MVGDHVVQLTGDRAALVGAGGAGLRLAAALLLGGPLLGLAP